MFHRTSRWVQLELSQEGVQHHLELFNKDPNYSILPRSARDFGWVPSEGWELYGLYRNSPGPKVHQEPVHHTYGPIPLSTPYTDCVYIVVEKRI